MRDASLAVYKALHAKLTGDATLTGIVPAAKIGSDWAKRDKPPFIRFQIPTVLPYEIDCIDGSEMTVTVHVYTQETGPVSSSQVAARVRDLLHEASLTLDGAELAWITCRQTRYMTDRDDPTIHTAIVTFEALTGTT